MFGIFLFPNLLALASRVNHNGANMIEREEFETKSGPSTSSGDNTAVSPTASGEERDFEFSLRPKTLAEFVGQEGLKENLTVFMQAAQKREEPIDHVLLYGNPGLGKTTLAHIIANEMSSQIRVTSGPALEKVGDLAAILSNLQKGDILFIDEIHRINKTIEEVLYPAMEDFALDIIVGKGPTARTLRLNLEHFTIIGATTRLSLLSAPLRDRFGMVHHLDFYEREDLQKILKRNAKLLQVPIHDDSVELLAMRSRLTPRIANRMLKRARDFAQVRGDGSITPDICRDALKMMRVDEEGLDAVDRHILTTIIEKFHGGPVGLSTIAASTQEEMETIEDVHEPYLLQLGFLARTPRGRIVTDRAYQHLGQEIPDRETLL
jgi:Holliday junction DNA helicase RuvB